MAAGSTRNLIAEETLLLLQAKENLKLNARRICGKLKVFQEKCVGLREGKSKQPELQDASTSNDDPKENAVSPKEHQSIKTLKWLEDNFIRCPGVCLPRCIMYAHYLSFCDEHRFRPACAATFGKIIRQKFPELTTRRLGTRGNSKYHYYGVAIKESSGYYHTVYSGRGLTRFSGSKLLSQSDASRKIITSAKSGTLLPEFPSPNQLIVPAHVEISKMDTFMIMYRTHCQCILDTAVSKNFEGINTYLVHFWQGIPKHLKTLFEVEEIIGFVCICDSITFMVLNDILVPVSLEETTEESLKEIRGFVGSLEKSLSSGLKGFHKNLLERKLNVIRRFVQGVQRQISFLRLAKSFREISAQKSITLNLLRELDTLDIKSIGAQACYTTVDCTQDQMDLHEEYLSELKELLKSESPVEKYIEWLEIIFKAQVLRHIDVSDFVSFKLRAQEFLLSWSFFGTRVMHMLTLNNSRTYGSFHLIRMMLDEYLLLITETKFSKQDRKELQTLSEKLIKGSSNELKISKVVTKSKFGAPSKRKLPHSLETHTILTNNNTTTGVQHEGPSPASKRRLIVPNQILPSISTLKRHQQQRQGSVTATSSTTTKGLHDNSNNNNMNQTTFLPNDQFTRLYGRPYVDDKSTSSSYHHSVVTLTPPSSPDIESSVEENVGNLVDEHFRKSRISYGIGGANGSTNGLVASASREQDFAGVVNRLLNGDEKNHSSTMNTYDVDPDEEMFFRHISSSASDDDDGDQQPLHCSFSQILKGGDVFFSDVLSEPIEPFGSNNTSSGSVDFSMMAGSTSSTFPKSGVDSNNNNTITGLGSQQQQQQSTAQAFSNLVNSMNLMDSFLESVGFTSTLYPGVEDEEFPTINTKSLQMTF